MSEQSAWDFERGELPHHQHLRKTALRLTRSTDSAQDLVQDTYLKAYRHYGTFCPGTNLRAWLLAILKNTFITEYRRRQKAPALVPLDQTQEAELAPAHASATRTPEDEVVEASLDADVKRALEELPSPYRVVVLLADIEEHAHLEIAAILSIPVGTVMSRLYRGRRLLERALLSYGVRHNYLRCRPRRLRSADLDLDRFFGVASPPDQTPRCESRP